MIKKKFFGRWESSSKKIVAISTKEDVNRKHNDREFYLVSYLDEESKSPYCNIQIHDTVFNIEFIDGLGRSYLRYRFREQKNGRLFLRGADFFEFDGVTDDSVKQTIFSFSIEGQLIITEFDYKKGEKTIKKANKLIDVSMLWEDYPEFGQYENLIKIERLPKEIDPASASVPLVTTKKVKKQNE